MAWKKSKEQCSREMHCHCDFLPNIKIKMGCVFTLMQRAGWNEASDSELHLPHREECKRLHKSELGVSVGAELGRVGSQVPGTEPISHHVYDSEEGHTRASGEDAD